MFKRILKVLLTLVFLSLLVFSSSVAVFAQTNAEGTSYSVDYNEENYTTDYSEMVAILKTAFVNREKNALLKFAMDEELDGATLHNLVDSWIEEALAVTDKADEGDYIQLHLDAYGTSAGRLWTNDGITYYYHIPYDIKYYTNREQEQAVTQKVKEVVESFGFTADTSEKEKCDAIYEYITKNIRYDTKNKTNPDYKLKFSAYAALINKTAVCQGYTALFYRLARECGLSVRAITGTSYGERHSWNIVKIGDYYYYLDSTWDEGKSSYSYYLKGTDTFLHHTPDDKFNTAEFKAEYPISKTSYSEESGNTCTSGHIYGGVCDSTCNVCGAVRDAISHTYDNGSDAVCNVCGDVRDLGYDFKLNLNQQLNLSYSVAGDFDYCLSDETVAKITKITTSESGGVITKIATITPLKSGYVTVEIVRNGTTLGKTVLYIVGCEHPVMNTYVITNATCTQDGTAVQKCALCDYSKDVVIEKIGHKFDNDCDATCNACSFVRSASHNLVWKTDKAETCVVNGLKHQECTVCGAKLNENTVILATGNHTYTNACDKDCNVCGNLRSVPDHVYDNSADESCNICGEIRGITHNYSWVTDKAATCGENGIKHEECSVCGIKRNENTVIPATNKHIYDNACDTTCNVCSKTRTITHSYKWIIDKAENCGVNGAKHEECTICGAKRNTNTVITATGKHTYDNACDTTCNVCSKTRTITHNYKWIIDKAENCGVNGAKHEECTVCGAKRNTNTVITATGKHTYDNACDTICNVCNQTRTVPAHVYDNASDKTCNVCGAIRDITHDYKWVVEKAATCGENGIKHEECSVCGIKRNENTVIPATNKHIYDNACDTTCNGCGKTRTITHSYKWIIDKAENCGVNGAKHEECTVCGAKRNTNTVITATGKHTYANVCDTTCNVCGKTRTITHDFLNATCTKAKTCKVCGVTEGEPLGHAYDNAGDEYCNICGEKRGVTHNYEWVIDKVATCGKNGIKHQECTDCGKVRNQNTVITATGNHSFVWIFDRKENCGIKGIMHEECSVCGLKQNENTEILPRGEHSYDDIIDDKCNVCGLTREIIPDQILSTDKIMGLMYTHTEDFMFVLSDETIAQITDLEVTQSVVDGVITKTVRADLTPLKPGYVILKIVTASNKTIAQTLVLVEEGSHQMQLAEVIKKANCTEDGSEKHICKFCGYTQTVTVNKIGHKYDNATDTTCNVCGDLRDIIPEQKITTDQKTTLRFSLPMDFEVELSDNTVAKIENIDITQQNIQGSIFNVASVTITPLKPGYVSVMILDTNRHVIAESLILVEEGEHKMQLAEILEIASCTTEGKEKHVCEYCGYSQVITIAKKTHQYTNDICDLCGDVREKLGPQLIKEDGKVYYYLDGEKQNITDLVKYDSQWIYVKDGVWQDEVNSLVKINGKWHYIKNGIFASNSTTLVKYNGKWYHVKNGLKTTSTTLVKYNGKWYYVEKGVKSTKTTLVKYNSKWYYVKKGVKNTATTLVKYNGKYYYVEKGIKKTATKLVKYNGKYYYVKSGKWDSSAKGIIKISGKYYYIKGGKWSKTTTLYKKSGKYYAVKSGMWYKSKAIIKYNGKKYYVNKGYAQTKYSGKVTISGKKYTVKKGIVK